MESYQTLNRELVLNVRDLRKENFDLRDLVNSLNGENIRINTEYSDFRRRALDKFTKLSEIIGTVGQDLFNGFNEAPKRTVEEEVIQKRFTMSEISSASSSLPRSSPEKMPRKLLSSHVVVGRRRAGQKIREAEAVNEDTEVQDMSIEDIRDWLRSDQIQISAPITEEHAESQAEATNSEIPEIPEEAPNNQEIIYKNMTTILEENSKSFSHNSLQVIKFASSTPHNKTAVRETVGQMELSPIMSSGSRESDERCLLTNAEKHERIFTMRSLQVSGESSETLQLPKSVTVRRRGKYNRDFTPDEPKEPSPEKNKEPSPEEYEVPEKVTPEVPRPKRKAVQKRTQRKRLADKTNLTENSPVSTMQLPKPIKVENLDDIVQTQQRPKRRAAPKNLSEPSLNEKLRRT